MELNWGQIQQLSGPLDPTDIIVALRPPFSEYVGTWQDVLDLVKTDGGLTTADIPDSADKRYVTDVDLEVLTNISGLTPANDDIIQRKSGSWTNRTPAQYKVDLALTKSDVGLSDVDNTSDADKPVSTAQAAAIAAVGATWTDYSGTSTIVGWSAFTTKLIQYNIIGSLMYIQYQIEGTGTGTTVTFTVPNNASAWGTQYFIGHAKNSTTQAAAVVSVAASGNVVTFSNSASTTSSWTNGVARDIQGLIVISI